MTQAKDHGGLHPARSSWTLRHPKGEPTGFADILDEGWRLGVKVEPKVSDHEVGGVFY